MTYLIKEDDLKEIPEHLKRFLPNYQIGYLPISSLNITQAYQRKLEPNRVKKICKNFNLEHLEPIRITDRIDEFGRYAVWDGQHSLAAIAEMAGVDDVIVQVELHINKTVEEEALLFDSQSQLDKPLSPYDHFIARYEAGEEKERLLFMITSSHGLHITNSSKDNHGIMSVSTLLEILDKYSAEVLNETLELIVTIWNYENTSLKKNILVAVSTILHIYGNSFDRKHAINVWSQTPLPKIIRIAKEKQISKSKNAYARTLIEIYNTKKKRGNLSIDKLS